jgi:hypothetical protein
MLAIASREDFFMARFTYFTGQFRYFWFYRGSGCGGTCGEIGSAMID